MRPTTLHQKRKKLAIECYIGSLELGRFFGMTEAIEN
jgi:hypothetical protein